MNQSTISKTACDLLASRIKHIFLNNSSGGCSSSGKIYNSKCWFSSRANYYQMRDWRHLLLSLFFFPLFSDELNNSKYQYGPINSVPSLAGELLICSLMSVHAKCLYYYYQGNNRKVKSEDYATTLYAPPGLGYWYLMFIPYTPEM